MKANGSRRRHLGVDTWRTLISEQAQSGLSQQAFCEKHGIGYSSFTAWRARLTKSPRRDANFIEVTASPPLLSCPPVIDWQVELELGGGMILRVGRRP